MNDADYISHDATGLATLVASGEVSGHELLDCALARADTWNPRLNAIVSDLRERARQHYEAGVPSGAFSGVPFLVKDLDGFLAGTEFTGSCRALQGFMPARDSELFRRYQQAGLVIMGKTNTPELGLLGTTESLFRGPCRNPWNPDYSTGGSSGGSAAAVAAGIVPMAHGGDGGGSIRIPAAACGLFGLKPTRARTPLGPDESEPWSGFVARHVVSRSVRDSARALDVTQGPEPGALYGVAPPKGRYADDVGRDPGTLRIAFSTASLLGRQCAPDCIAAVRRVAGDLAALGHELVEDTPRIDREALARSYLMVVAVCTAASVIEFGELRGRAIADHELEPVTRFLCALGRIIPASQYELARQTYQREVRSLVPFFERFDVFMDATLAHPVARIGDWSLPRALEIGIRMFAGMAPRALMMKALEHFASDGLERTANTMLFNMSGQPGMSVPLASDSAGLPLGIQFVGRFGDEHTLFRLAGQLERAFPWQQRLPMHHGLPDGRTA